LCYAAFIFTLMNPAGSILGRVHRLASSTSVISTPIYPLLWHAIPCSEGYTSL